MPRADLFPNIECAGCLGPPHRYTDHEGNAVIEEHCACGPQERVLRHILAGTWPHLPLTPEQRAWMVDDADWAAEGGLTKAELEAMTDRDLASALMGAWADYARSQGLL
jgi:hypothetical protein